MKKKRGSRRPASSCRPASRRPCRPAIPQSARTGPAISAAAIRTAASRAGSGAGSASAGRPGAGVAVGDPARLGVEPEPRPPAQLRAVRAAIRPASVSPAISGATLRIRPTPTTAPVPSTNVPPKYACIDRNEPSPTWTRPTSGSPIASSGRRLSGRAGTNAGTRPTAGRRTGSPSRPRVPRAPR